MKTKKTRSVSDVRSRRDLTAGVALFFFMVWVFFTHAHVGSFNDRSRMAAIDSLVVRGTWAIDDSPFSYTVDRIYVDGAFYSDKPPVLTFVASGVYAVLHRGFHLSLDAGWCDADQGSCHCRGLCDDDPDWAYYLLTLTLVGFPSALMLALFYRLTGFFGLDNGAALLLTGALALATQIFPYSTTFNSHVPAAACLLAGFYALSSAARGRRSIAATARTNRWLFASGLLTGLAFTCDLGVGLFFVAFFGYAMWGGLGRAVSKGGERWTSRFGGVRTLLAEVMARLPWSYLLGGLLPVALMIILNYQIVGNPLPPYMYTPGYDYPGSRFPQTIAGNRSPENLFVYGWRLLLGDHGLFAFNPVLLWAVIALVRVWRKSPSKDVGPRPEWLRLAAVTVGLTSGLFALYFILFTDNFGGAAYGPRWYTVFIPLFFVFVAADWKSWDPEGTPARLGWWSWRLLFVALVGISLVNSCRGAINPWRAITPLLRVELAPSGPQEPVDMALSGVIYEEIEPDLLSTFDGRRVDKRWFDARLCLVIPPGPVWLFIDDGTPLDPALAERSDLASGNDLSCHVDLRPVWEAYRGSLATSTWISSASVPSDSDPAQKTSVILPADFGGQFSLLGYELLDDERVSEGEVGLVTAWRVEKRPESSLAVFVHLLDRQGEILGQFDGLGVDPYSLRAGDVLLHVHRFKVQDEALSGRHWLQVGLYNPETMVRFPLTGYSSDRLLLTRVEGVDR